MKRYSLALEGGGAKGAYQIGAYKAFIDSGYEFEAVIGTSIGAINAAFIAQGDLEKLEELWKTLSFSDLMDIDGDELNRAIESKSLTRKTLHEISRATVGALKTRGIDTIQMRKLLEKYINEEKVRNSKIRFGLVTFNVSDFKPEKLFIEDIPKGKLVDYLLASSNLPVFKRAKINDKNFMDGGVFDNCSVEMLYDAGYTNVIASRLYLLNRIRNYYDLKKKKDLKLSVFVPSMRLPFMLDFSTNTLNNMIEFGYVDTIKQIKKLEGDYYTIDKISKERLDKVKEKITPIVALNISKLAGVKYEAGENIVDIAFSKTIPKLSRIADYKTNSFKKQILNIIEYVAVKEEIKPNKIYSFDDLLLLIKEKIKDKDLSKMKDYENAMYQIAMTI